MKKIVATPRSFGKTNKAPIELLEKAGYEVIMNPVGRIMTEQELITHLADAEGVIIGVDPLSATVLEHTPHLKAISKYGVGTDNIDLEKAKQLNIPVSVTRGANSEAVADYAFALLSACARNVIEIDEKCRKKDWSKITTLDIYGKKLGILGLGEIGKGLARRGQGFGMNILAYDLFWDKEYAKTNHITYAAPTEIFAECDFISLHLPLTEETRNMISDNEFAMMKPTSILINTARGGIIDEQALIKALREKQIYAAGIDAFAQEPPENQDIYLLDNLIMGSHCAASTVGAIDKMGLLAAENLLQSLET